VSPEDLDEESIRRAVEATKKALEEEAARQRDQDK
jgi:hypothetical protein